MAVSKTPETKEYPKKTWGDIGNIYRQ